MKRYLPKMLFLLLLAGCTSAKSPEYITYYLNRAYANRPADEFFANYGYPSAEWGGEGNTIYRWDSMHHRYAPTSTTTVASTSALPQPLFTTSTAKPPYSNGGTVYTDAQPAYPATLPQTNGIRATNTDTYHGSVEHNYCEIRVYTRGGVIQNFAVVVDTIGTHSTSRCSEIFDKVYPDTLWF